MHISYEIKTDLHTVSYCYPCIPALHCIKHGDKNCETLLQKVNFIGNFYKLVQ